MQKTVFRSVTVFGLWLFIIIVSANSYAEDKTVTMVADPWAPYYAEELPGHGFAADIIREALSRKSYAVKFFVKPWKRSLKDVQEGTYDAISTAWYNDERATIYTYSKPYGECRIVFFSKKKKPVQWETLKDLKSLRIGIVRGYSYSPEFSGATFLKTDEADNISINIKKLLKDRTDTILMDKYVGLYTLKKDFPSSADSIIYNDKPISVNKLHCLFSRNVQGIEKKIEAFNSGLDEIINDGTYEKILIKHNLK